MGSTSIAVAGSLGSAKLCLGRAKLYGRFELVTWKRRKSMMERRFVTSLLLMYQVKVAAGLDRGEVQLTLTTSPTWYRCLPLEIRGPMVGKTIY